MKKIIVDMEEGQFAVEMILALIYAGADYDWYLKNRESSEDCDITEYKMADFILTDSLGRYGEENLRDWKGKLINVVDDIEEEDLDKTPYRVCVVDGAKKLCGKLKYIFYGELKDKIDSGRCKCIFLSTTHMPALTASAASCICKVVWEQLNKKVMYVSLSSFAPMHIFNTPFPTCNNYEFVRLMLRLKNDKLYPLELLLTEIEGFYVLNRPPYWDGIWEFTREINERLVSIAVKYGFEVLVYDLGCHVNGEIRKLIAEEDDFIEVYDKESGAVQLVDLFKREKWKKNRFVFGDEFGIEEANLAGLNKGFGVYVSNFVNAIFEENKADDDKAINIL